MAIDANRATGGRDLHDERGFWGRRHQEAPRDSRGNPRPPELGR